MTLKPDLTTDDIKNFTEKVNCYCNTLKDCEVCIFDTGEVRCVLYYLNEIVKEIDKK